MIAPAVVLGASLLYLGLLFAVAWWGDRRAAAGRSLIGNAWIYTLSLAVYCTAWTYFGSVGRAASGGVWFLPIYLGPMLAMILAWTVLRKLLRISRAYRITSIADFVASRYGKSPLLAGLVTLITVVGIVPYIALQLKAVAGGYALMTGVPVGGPGAQWWSDGALYVALALAGFTILFGTRHLDNTERHEGMVLAIAFESLVKLLAFLAVGVAVVWGLHDGARDLFARAAASPELQGLLRLSQGRDFPYAQWFALTLLSMLSVVFLPRQFQVLVVENVDERHLKRAAWAFPAYLLLINLFVLPIALAGLMHFGPDSVGKADGFVISLPLTAGWPGLALVAFVGGLSAATGMVIVEAIAVSTMVCNDLVMPLLLRHARWAQAGDLSGLLLGIRRAAIVGILLLGYLYYHLAGEAYALVSIGLISFAAVAQFAPAVLGGMYWRGATRAGALIGLCAGFLVWVYTLMLPSLAKSGWVLTQDFLAHGPWGLTLLRPEQLFALGGLDNLTHSLFWSLLANVGAYIGVSLARRPSAIEASQALLFVEVEQHLGADGQGGQAPLFWRGRARVADLRALAARFLGEARADELLQRHAAERGLSEVSALQPDARLVHHVERQLAGAIGSASARVMVASAVDEDTLGLDDVLRIVDEASQLRAYSLELEAQRESLRRATAELQTANAQLQSLDRLKDDFMSSMTHELRTPLTSIRALAELMRDEPDMAIEQREQFLAIVVAESKRLSRLVNQVLDLAKIESGHAAWFDEPVDPCQLAERAAQTLAEMLRERGLSLRLDLQASDPALPRLVLDADRLMQVLVNLLSNAAKFAPPQTGHIELSLHGDSQGLNFRVRDDGPGVPDAERALVFEKFRQGSDGIAKPHSTGLGLPICKQIIEHYGGHIVLEPPGTGLGEAGAGASFAFTLPWPAAADQGRATTPHEETSNDVAQDTDSR